MLFRYSFLVVVLNCSVQHLELHSFPTRRSSDLSGRSCHQSAFQAGWTRGRSHAPRPNWSPEWFHRAVHVRRSEEHTSELQSRGHLVCRLLLEKKNRYFKTFDVYVIY